jgi:hypothetical protein
MKRTLVAIVLVAAIASLSFYAGRSTAEKPILQNKTVTQVALVVKDIHKTSAAWCKLLGVPMPEISTTGNVAVRPTLYKGNPTNAKAKLAFFKMDNLQIELIQPLGPESTWQEYLDNQGEGIPTVMRGGWDSGAYSYIDATNDLGCIIELLENY